jgi:uncharacterized tellurite resistance protein B-like protein
MSLLEILLQFKQGKGSAKSHIKNLIEMAAVDGKFLEVENTLLKSIAIRNGISEKQLIEIRKNPGSVKLEIPEDAKERFHQFYDLVQMMSIDNLIHTEEMKLSNLFAIKFGYHRDNIEQLISSIISCIEYNRDADETMSRVIMLIQ